MKLESEYPGFSKFREIKLIPLPSHHQQDYYDSHRTMVDDKVEENAEDDDDEVIEEEKEKQETNQNHEKSPLNGQLDHADQRKIHPNHIDHQKSGFKVYNSACKGLVFLEIRYDVDIDLFVSRMFDIIKEHEIEKLKKANKPISALQSVSWSKTFWIAKIVPVHRTCRAELESICDSAIPLIHTHLNESSIPTKWAIILNRTNNENVDKKTLIDKLAKLVPSKHTVSLNDPELIIMVNIIKSACCISISRDYKRLNKFNIDSYLSPIVES